MDSKKLWTSSKYIQGYAAKEGHKVNLSTWPTVEKPKYNSKSDWREQMEAVRKETEDRESILYADGRSGLLVIFQGMDTAGKDGTIKHVMSGLNPQSTIVTAFGSPSKDELHHDFLWRTHSKIPERGRIGIFNRSYYEDCLTVRVHPELLAAQHLPPTRVKTKTFWHERLKDIRHHEDYLGRQGYKIIKFLLHISKDEQKKRLLSRLEERDKNWKFDPSDASERKYWKQLQSAYEHCIAETSTANAPWYIIPADDKPEARLTVSHILLHHMNQLPLAYPTVSPAKRKDLKKVERELRSGKL